MEYTTGLDAFIRLLGLIYTLAFASLAWQVKALFGEKGLCPAKKNTCAPSLFNYRSDDRFLEATAWTGAWLGVLVAWGIFPTILLTCLFLLYLSFLNSSSLFLSYQWDILLVELGFFGIFLSLSNPTSPLLWAAYCLLNVRFIFSSGFVKIASGDPTWRNFTAMSYHYESQPLPTRLAWYAHHLPIYMHKASCIAMFSIELFVPAFLLFPDPFRIGGVIALSILQIGIMLTGNYTFFNWLSIFMLLPLVHNDYFPWTVASHGQSSLSYAFTSIVGLGLFTLNALQVARLFTRDLRLEKLFYKLSPYRISNSYGLFAVMTLGRDEIIFEGSHDGEAWLEYRLPYNPSLEDRPPKWVAPHQPRLDWQLWFASKQGLYGAPWVRTLMLALLEDKRDILSLFEHNPFEGMPPKYVRALLYKYSFSQKGSKSWWNREFRGIFAKTMVQ